MKTLEELKKEWSENTNTSLSQQAYGKTDLEKIFKARVKKHTNIAMQYFWASFTLQVIIYALLSHDPNKAINANDHLKLAAFAM